MAGTDRDRSIGANLTALRGNMSQAKLATEMAARGHKWSQATVWSVEKGDRPLRFSEAIDLQEILNVGTSDFLRTDSRLKKARETFEAVAESRRAIASALREHVAKQGDFRHAVKKAWESVPEERARMAQWIEHALGPDAAPEALGKSVGHAGWFAEELARLVEEARTYGVDQEED